MNDWNETKYCMPIFGVKILLVEKENWKKYFTSKRSWKICELVEIRDKKNGTWYVFESSTEKFSIKENNENYVWIPFPAIPKI